MDAIHVVHGTLTLMSEQRPTVVRRQLGRRLRQHREAAGKTHDDVTEAGLASRSKMWKIESGRVPVRQGDILALARLYHLGGHQTDELLGLAAASKDTGFLESYGSSVPEWVGMYGDLEAAASRELVYASELIPGILQCASYARHVMAVDTTLTPDAIEQRVSFRGQRQKAFLERNDPGQLDAVVTAGALNLHVGSSSTVMEEQLAHMRAINDGKQVTVRILPSTNGLHTAMRGPFTILLFADDADPDLVYVESVVGARYFERDEHVSAFRQAFKQMRTNAVSLEDYIDEH